MKKEKPRPIVKIDDNAPTPPPGAYLAATEFYKDPPPADASASYKANADVHVPLPQAAVSSGIQYQPSTELYAAAPPTQEASGPPDRAQMPVTQVYGVPPHSPAASSTNTDSSDLGETSSSSASTGAEDLLAGTPYRLMHKLGEGGTGDVYAAQDTQIGEPVVVKLLAPELGPSFEDRMRLGADALRRLPHPHIVEILDSGRTPKGRSYIVMERLYGRTLHDELRSRGPLPIGEAIRYTLQVLDGLAAAHARGLVHRDIKLENLFLCDTPDGKFI